MRRGAASLAALGVATFLLAAWVTSATYVPILRGVEPSEPSRRRGELPPIERPVTESSQGAKHAVDQGLGLPVTIVLYAVLILLLAALGAIIFRRVAVRRRLRRQRVEPAAEESTVDGWEIAVADRLARSAGRGLAALSEGDPRNAIVRCWVELEDAVERIGLARDPALTSEEFTAAVLARYAVGRAQIETLGALYREARFSEHPMGEPHRDKAVGALTTLRDELRRSQESEQADAAEVGP